MGKMHEVLGCMCMVAMPDGEQRGIIDSIDSLTIHIDFNENFPLTRFEVLTEVVHCFG
jgi:hypothetical protein